jgi:hypothetical protein
MDYKKYLAVSFYGAMMIDSLPISKVSESGDDVVVLVQSLVDPSGNLSISLFLRGRGDTAYQAELRELTEDLVDTLRRSDL